MKLLALVLLSSAAFAQLPDAPQPILAGVRFSDYASPQMQVHPPRGRHKLWALAGAAGFDIAAGLYDAHETTYGLKHSGGYVEANPWLIGTHPSFQAIEARNVLQLGLCSTPSMLLWMWRKTPLYYAFLGAPVVDGVKHVQGGDAWVRLEK